MEEDQPFYKGSQVIGVENVENLVQLLRSCAPTHPPHPLLALVQSTSFLRGCLDEPLRRLSGKLIRSPSILDAVAANGWWPKRTTSAA